MRYFIREHNVGRLPKLIQVYDQGVKRNAWFTQDVDAAEAIRIIETLRIDTAYLKCEIVAETSLVP